MPHFIFIQQISVLIISNMPYNLHIFSSKCVLFHNATLFGFCITHILNTGCAKIWRKKSVAKRLNSVWSVLIHYKSELNYQRFSSIFMLKPTPRIQCFWAAVRKATQLTHQAMYSDKRRKCSVTSWSRNYCRNYGTLHTRRGCRYETNSHVIRPV